MAVDATRQYRFRTRRRWVWFGEEYQVLEILKSTRIWVGGGHTEPGHEWRVASPEEAMGLVMEHADLSARRAAASAEHVRKVITTPRIHVAPKPAVDREVLHRALARANDRLRVVMDEIRDEVLAGKHQSPIHDGRGPG